MKEGKQEYSVETVFCFNGREEMLYVSYIKREHES